MNLPAKYWVGFDLGGTKMMLVIFDAAMKPIFRKRKKTKTGESATDGLVRIENFIRKSLEEAKIALTDVLGIGIGVPGPVEWDTGIVRVAVNLGWKDVPVKAFLEKQFGCPAAVLNDVDAGVYGEYRFGAGRGAYCAVGFFPGTGVGGGCVYQGAILRGAKLSCMELGHMRISSSGRYGGIKMTGTLESEASRLTIAAELAKLSFRGEAPHLNEIAGSDLAKIRSKSMAEAIEAGDKSVDVTVRTAAKQLGMGVVNMIHVLGPDKIILGGGLVEAMPKLFVDEVTATAKKYVLDCYAGTYKVCAAELGDDACAMGAAAWVAIQTGIPIEPSPQPTIV